jgi:dTMP kinase
MARRGRLIVIDGIDKVGKETQTKLLVARLKQEGKKVKAVHFPRYEENFMGALIKECIEGKHGEFAKLSPHIASVLYAADRFETKQTLKRWLTEGYTVIANRYVTSNQIHQGGKISSGEKRRAFLTWLSRLEYGVFGLPRPDLVVFLDVPVAVSIQLMHFHYRVRGAPDTLERNLSYMKNSAQAARLLARQEKWKVVPCVKRESGEMFPREVIHAKIYKCVRRAL